MSKEYVQLRDGGYFVSGTRVSLDSLIYAFRRGESPEAICQNFDTLRLEEVFGAIAYYLAKQDTMDAFLATQAQLWEDAGRASQPFPATLREKLSLARQDLHTGSHS